MNKEIKFRWKTGLRMYRYPFPKVDYVTGNNGFFGYINSRAYYPDKTEWYWSVEKEVKHKVLWIFINTSWERHSGTEDTLEAAMLAAEKIMLVKGEG